MQNKIARVTTVPTHCKGVHSHMYYEFATWGVDKFSCTTENGKFILTYQGPVVAACVIRKAHFWKIFIDMLLRVFQVTHTLNKIASRQKNTPSHLSRSPSPRWR